MASKFEVRAYRNGKADCIAFNCFDQAECYAERLAFEGNQVELHRLNERPNLPNCLPKIVTNIIRLDVYYVENGHLFRKMCNIF
jgi:hypothetical protein